MIVMIFHQYLQGNSLIHQWQHQAKIVALLSLIFAFAFIKNLVLLPVIIILTSLFYFLAKLPLSFLLKKLKYPGLFIVAIVFFLPFVSGKTIILSLGWLTIKKEGCLAVLLILTRLICILTLSLVLFATAPFLSSIKALRSLGLSAVIIDMMLLSYRYLEELAEMLEKMQHSMQLRGFKKRQFSQRNLKILAQLIGTLLIRSYEKSQRVYQAMILRGYGSKSLHPKQNKIQLCTKEDKISWVASFITILTAITLIMAEIYL